MTALTTSTPKATTTAMTAPTNASDFASTGATMTIPQKKMHARASPTALAERPRRVSFRDAICVQKGVLGLGDFTQDEIQNCWYTSAELMRMRPKAKHLGDCLKNCCGVDCMRGLENRTRAGIDRRRRTMISAGFGVLEEQTNQQAHDKYDPDRISQIYSRRSRHCQNLAFLKGLIDEQYLREHIDPSMPRSSISLKAQEHPNWERMDVCSCHEVSIDKPVNTQASPSKIKKSKTKATKTSSSRILQGVMQTLRLNRRPIRSKAFVACA